MTDVYATKCIRRSGTNFKVEWCRDQGAEPPWRMEDGHGPVSDWVTRPRRGGELVLAWGFCERRYYDMEAAVRKALDEKWGVGGPDIAQPQTPIEKARAAAEADFARLRDWCDGAWFYCGLVVTRLDDDGNELNTASLCGLESDADDYHKEVIAELVQQLIPPEVPA